MNFGETFKQIRENKNLSQKELTKNIVTQGAYSNFESLNTDIKVSTFYKLLERLTISPEEFDFILNNYNYNVRNSLLQRYLRLPFNQTEQLQKLMDDLKVELKVSSNDLLEDILMICEALLLFYKSNDKEKLHITLSKVWENMEKKDQLYLTDIYLLNSILFLFPIDTANNLKHFLFKSIDRYKNFQNINKMKLTINMNLSLMYIEEGRYKEALIIIDEATVLSRTFCEYVKLAFCYYRKGICLKKLQSDGDTWMDKALDILRVIERDDIYPILENEKSRYLKS